MQKEKVKRILTSESWLKTSRRARKVKKVSRSGLTSWGGKNAAKKKKKGMF